MYRTFSRLTVAAIALLLAAACGDDGSEPEEGNGGSVETTELTSTTAAPVEEVEEPMALGSVVEVAVASGEFPTLVAAVEAAGLVEVLNGDGPFTVFAPTEDAFAEALDMLGIGAEELLADTELLTYHVLPVTAPAETVLTLNGENMATVNGAEIAISVDDGTVRVNNATVVTTDIQASNGTIHVIDTVLIPPAEE